MARRSKEVPQHILPGRKQWAASLSTCPNRTYLLVDLGTVVESLLSSTGRGPLHASRVPRANAGHLAEAAVGLAGQAGDAPALDDALGAVALGDGDGVNHLVGLEHSVHGNLLLKQTVAEVDLGGDGASVDLQRGQHA